MKEYYEGITNARWILYEAMYFLYYGSGSSRWRTRSLNDLPCIFRAIFVYYLDIIPHNQFYFENEDCQIVDRAWQMLPDCCSSRTMSLLMLDGTWTSGSPPTNPEKFWRRVRIALIFSHISQTGEIPQKISSCRLTPGYVWRCWQRCLPELHSL